MLFDLHPKEKPESLYGRDDDLSKIVGHIENHRWISILGPRMVGKTSIVKAAGSLPGADTDLSDTQMIAMSTFGANVQENE